MKELNGQMDEMILDFAFDTMGCILDVMQSLRIK